MKRALPALLLLATVIVAVPAIRGDWVYDDKLMLGHAFIDDLSDLTAAFSRNSLSYQQNAPGVTPGAAPSFQGSVTYRPLPMVSFILVNGTLGEKAWAHHLVSLLFHLLTVALLLCLNRGSARGYVIVGIFALHPALSEAFHWINGRSDAMAGLALVGLMALGTQRSVWARAAIPLVCLCGLLCKETFLLPAGALIVSWAFTGDRRGSALGLASLFAATVAFFVLRKLTIVGAVPAMPSDLSPMLWRAPRIIALAVETLLLPLPRPMRNLSWELAQAWTVTQILALIAAGVGLGCLVWRKQFRALILVLGAIATLLPPALVSDWFWLGFDRYLYLPALLLVWAALPQTGGLSNRAQVCAAIFLALLGAAGFSSAGFYKSHSVWIESMVEARPEDPSGYVWAARDFGAHGELNAARELLRRVPPSESSPPVAHEIVLLRLKLKLKDEAIALVEAMHAAHPENQSVKFDLMLTRADQRRWPEALDLSRELIVVPKYADGTKAFIRDRLAKVEMPPDVRASFEALLR